MFDLEFLVWLCFRMVVVLELSVIFKLLSGKLQIDGQICSIWNFWFGCVFVRWSVWNHCYF